MKRRKLNVKEKAGYEVYANNQSLVYVSKEISGDLCFESNSMYLNHFMSYDIGESVAAIMRVKSIKKDDSIWAITINEEKQYDVDAEKCLYWLTGGDKVWRTDSKKFKYSWSECSGYFVDEFSNIIYDIIDDSKTLGDIREYFKKCLNLQVFYEFSLEKNLIKM